MSFQKVINKVIINHHMIRKLKVKNKNTKGLKDKRVRILIRGKIWAIQGGRMTSKEL